jgi:hypothetical protein
VRQQRTAGFLLVRPDGYIAWAGRTGDDGWRPALAAWTGHGARTGGPVPA